MSELSDSLVCVIHSPMDGEICPLEDLPDPVFANHMIGDGVAIVPDSPVVCTPADGKIISVFDTKHALVFENKKKFRVLLHVGIGSMRLQGEGFEAYVDNGQNVSSGDELLSLDLDYIKKEAETLASPVVLTSNKNRYKVRVVAKGHIKVGEPLFEIFEAAG